MIVGTIAFYIKERDIIHNLDDHGKKVIIPRKPREQVINPNNLTPRK